MRRSAYIAPFPCDYLQFSNTLHTCIAAWATKRLPFKKWLMLDQCSVSKVTLKKKKNRLDFFQKSYLLLLLEVINVYEVVFVYITRLVWVVLQNIMLS